MIATITGVVAERDGETVVLQTDGGVGYEVQVPAGVAARLPGPGQRALLHTELVVREDGWQLFGFDQPSERTVFRRLLLATGFGPKLALAVLSSLGPERTVRAIQQRDLAALSSVSGVGKKKAERLALELGDRFKDLVVSTAPPASRGAEDAIRALVGLGYPYPAADDAVRAALGAGASEETPTLIRAALQQLAAARGGR